MVKIQIYCCVQATASKIVFIINLGFSKIQVCDPCIPFVSGSESDLCIVHDCVFVSWSVMFSVLLYSILKLFLRQLFTDIFLLTSITSFVYYCFSAFGMILFQSINLYFAQICIKIQFLAANMLKFLFLLLQHILLLCFSDTCLSLCQLFEGCFIR